MKRFAILALLVLAPGAHAEPRALGPAESLALVDGAAYVAHAADDRVTVVRIPLDGGRRAVVLDEAVPPDRTASVRVAAGPERVGVHLTLSDPDTALFQSFEVRAGPPSGPLTTVTEPAGIDHPTEPWPSTVDAAGDTVFINELDGPENRWVAVAPDGARTLLDLPPDRGPLDFAGDLIAFGELTDDETIEDLPTHVTIRNWRTGATVRTVALPSGISTLDLRADGRVLLGLQRGSLYELTAGGRLRRLSDEGFSPAAAGDAIVVRDFSIVPRGEGFNQSERLRVLDGDGDSQHLIGLRTRFTEDVAGDSEHVVWRSNGCAFVADIDDGPSRTFANAGCPASEADVVTPRKKPPLARSVRIGVRCLNSAEGICRGSLEGEEIHSERYAVRAGMRKKITVRLRRDSYRHLRRERRPFLQLTAPRAATFLLAR